MKCVFVLVFLVGSVKADQELEEAKKVAKNENKNNKNLASVVTEKVSKPTIGTFVADVTDVFTSPPDILSSPEIKTRQKRRARRRKNENTSQKEKITSAEKNTAEKFVVPKSSEENKEIAAGISTNLKHKSDSSKGSENDKEKSGAKLREYDAEEMVIIEPESEENPESEEPVILDMDDSKVADSSKQKHEKSITGFPEGQTNHDKIESSVEGLEIEILSGEEQSKSLKSTERAESKNKFKKSFVESSEEKQIGEIEILSVEEEPGSQESAKRAKPENEFHKLTETGSKHKKWGKGIRKSVPVHSLLEKTGDNLKKKSKTKDGKLKEGLSLHIYFGLKPIFDALDRTKSIFSATVDLSNDGPKKAKIF